MEEMLKITELAEKILLHLPMQDLLLMQRVNVRAKALITDSRPLQEALYMAPAPTHTKNGQIIRPVLNPLIRKYFNVTPLHLSRDGSTNCVKYILKVWWKTSTEDEDEKDSWRKMLVAQPAGNIHSLDVWVFHPANDAQNSVQSPFFRAAAPCTMDWGIIISTTSHEEFPPSERLVGFVPKPVTRGVRRPADPMDGVRANFPGRDI